MGVSVIITTYNRFQNVINAIGAIIGGAFVTVSLIDVSFNADVWINQDLLSKSTPKSVIVMDNTKFYKYNYTASMLWRCWKYKLD